MNFFANLKKHKVLCVLVCLLLIVAAAVAVVFGVNRFTLTAQLRGESEITVEYGEKYTDLGANAVVRGSLFLKNGFSPDVNVLTEGTVDTAKIGTYTVSYQAEFFGLTATATRTVHVVDSTAPVIQLQGDAEVHLYVGDC